MTANDTHFTASGSSPGVSPSPKPATIPYTFDKIPPYFRERPQWVCWKYILRDGKWTKPPFRATKIGVHAKSTDRITWATFEEAVAAYQNSASNYDGIGYAIDHPSEQIVAVDLDDVLDGQSEPTAFSKTAKQITTTLNSYTEISPSGRGLHVYAFGPLPSGGCRKGNVEMYAKGRYLTFTGRRVKGPHTIEHRAPEIAAVHQQYVLNVSKPVEPPAPLAIPSSTSPMVVKDRRTEDDEIVVRALAAANGEKFKSLFVNGDTSAHGGDDSAADLALCSMLAFWTRDPDQIDRLMRRSALGKRAKWNRDDYRERTIGKALDGVTETYGRQRDADSVGDENEIDQDPPLEVNLVEQAFTDVGNAERLIECYGDRIRYCDSIGWLVWDGKRWKTNLQAKQGDRLPVMRMAIKTIRHFRQQAAEIPDPITSAAALKAALKSESRMRLEAMIEVAKSHPSIYVRADQLDQDAHLLNVMNGTLDLRTCELRVHSKEDLLTRMIAVDYDQTATAPMWMKFLDQVLEHCEPVIAFLQRAIGYSLTGLVREHALFIPYGIGANGKSTFLGAIHDMLGEYSQVMPPDTLMSKRHEGIPNDIARLKGTRFVIAIETKRGRQFDESMVKKLTGGDPLTGRFLHKEFFDFVPTHKLFFGTNHKPAIKDTTNSIWRRVKLIPFTVSIPEADQDTALGEKLKAEAAGILAWAVEGCRQWLAGGLQPPPEVVTATEQYRQEQDSLAGFVEECLEIKKGHWATVAAIYTAYEVWADEGDEEPSGQEEKADLLPSREVTRYLVETYGLVRETKKVGSKAQKVILGVGIKAAHGSGPEAHGHEENVSAPGTSVTKVTELPGVLHGAAIKKQPGITVTTVTGAPEGDRYAEHDGLQLRGEAYWRAQDGAQATEVEGQSDEAPF